MTITITGRHSDISDEMKNYVRGKLEAVLSGYPQVEYVHVVMDIQRFRHVIEVTLQGRQHLRMEASEESDDMYSSVDLVCDKVSRQLRRFRDKVVDHKGVRNRAKLADFEKESP